MRAIGQLAILLAAIGAAQGVACPRPQGYSGAMVLPTGSAAVEDCTPEFPSDGAKTFLEHDYVKMDRLALTPQPAASTVEACQALCKAADDPARGCQYFLFDSFAAAGKRCSLRLRGVAPAKFGPKHVAEPKVVFQVSPGRYSAYAADRSDWTQLGVDISSYPSLTKALAACGAAAECVGVKYDGRGGDRPYKTFAGSLGEGVTGKVRSTGPSINPWASYKSRGPQPGY